MMIIIRKTTTKSIVSIVSVMVLLLSLGSCQDYLDVQPEDKLIGDQVYRNVYDADAAVIGIYGKFMGLAEKYVILNEMRADLMTTTRNSSPYLKQLSEHNVTSENPYINPKQFYEVIQNCNDVLKNFDIMLADKKFTQSQYEQRYADVGCIRSWVYLQLGIHFGSVPYITEPIETLEEVKNTNKYPRISFDQLIDNLVVFTEGLNYKKVYDLQSSLVVTVDGYNTAKFFINKECLLGDLQLWKGNYLAAASHYKIVLETGSTSPSDVEKFDFYRVKGAEVVSNNDLAVGYIRYSEQNARSLINSDTQGWRSMFGRERDVLWNMEWIWSLPFDSDFAPANPFIAIFSKTAGNYLAKPSERAIKLWNSQTQFNTFPYDARGPKFTYKLVGEDPVIMKYLYKFEAATDPFKRDGDWFLYRAAKLHLRYAEAANRDNHQKIAYAILNFGIQSAFNANPLPDDVTNIQQTFEAFPYDFDARNGEFPRYRANWHRGAGIRGRAYVTAVGAIGDDMITTENNIIDEAALELAYEGNRWEDLVRIARRRNDPAFLADKIFDKLNQEGNPEAANVRAKLMNPTNWYLPFNW
ncbi:MAG: RagB/SusD family nutrient uptake outer membrane protein [Flavobacterium sp.]